MRCIFKIIFCFIFVPCLAQTPNDSTKKKSFTRKAINEGISLISTSAKDTINNEESTDSFQPYQGKIIRTININFIGFERSIYDSTKRTQKIITNLADALHTRTKEKVIRNHLFIKENKPLNPYLLADNERFLRTLNFILDSRIVVTPIDGTDSVDLMVITRDVFSLGVKVGGSPPTSTELSVYDANLGGQGQRLQFDGLLDVDRTPNFGYGAYYKKNSLLGSLTNVEFGYTQLNQGSSYGDEEEFAYFLKASRPLVSPYSRLAGGFEMSRNWSENVYKEPDSLFLDYKYDVFDTWIGYNFGIRRSYEDRKRRFLAVRYFDGVFTETPDQVEYEDVRDYNSIKGWLAEATFYRQNYFKTRYVFGFGRTEDIPYGFNLAFSGGYITTLSIARPYVGAKGTYSKASRSGSFYGLHLEAGTYYRDESFEDITLNAFVSYYTKAMNINRYKLRTSFGAGISNLSNRVTNNYIQIDKNEVHGFSADSLLGTQRITLKYESALYAPWSLLGFRFAPFVGVDLSTMDCVVCDNPDKSIFGFNTGFRTRNENLIFGTMEVRMTYIPDDGTGNSKFVFGFKANLRPKDEGIFVNAPSLVRN